MESAAAAHARLAAKPEPPRRVRAVGFKGADFSRLTMDWAPSLVPADEEIRHALPRLRARARELGRNNPYVRQYLNLLRVNVIGPEGFRLQAQVRNNDGRLAKLINDRLEAAWLDFSRAPTVDGKQSLTAFQQGGLASTGMDGEIFVRMHRGFDNAHGFALEAIDPDLLDEAYNRQAGAGGPEIRLGVEVDTYGRPLAYHFWTAPPFYGYGGPTTRQRVRVPADQIIHLYAPDRFAQTRGVTWLAPVMYALNMLDGYEDAEITKCRVTSSAMGIWQRKDDGGPLAEGEDGRLQIEANPGTFAFAPDGYELSTWDPNSPHSNYPTFVKGVLRKIASGLGLSYNVLANDLEGVNYSSMRSGLLIERDLWRGLQVWWREAFLERVYREWLGMSLLAGGVTLDSRDRRKFLAARWVPRGWAWVDPSKDVDAGIKEIQTGLGSRTALLAEQGKDLEDVLEQLAEEKKLAAEHGVEIAGPQAAAAAAEPEPEPEPEDETDNERGLALMLAAGGSNGKG